MRLDAGFHLSDGSISTKKILNGPLRVENLKWASKDIFYGGRARRIYVKDKALGIPYMGGAAMLKSDFNNLKLISRKLTKGLDSYMLKEDWILVSRSGTVGNTAYTNGDFLGKAGSDDIIRIVPNGKILPGTLYAYLSSKDGYAMITQGAFGAVIKHVELNFLENIPVPAFKESFQNQVHGLIAEAARQKEAATQALARAHALLTEQLFYKKEPKPSTIGSYRISDIRNTFQFRLDANFYVNLISHEKNFRNGLVLVPLKDLVQRPMFTSLRGKRNYVKRGTKFLSTTEISQSNPLLINRYISSKTVGLTSLIVEKNWILIARSGSEILGSCFLVDSSYDQTAVNEHSIRVVIDKEKIQLQYVFAYLSHPLIKGYIRAGIYGSAILTINEDYLERIKVPILETNTIERITNDIIRYQQCKEEACRLEFEAVSLIEQEIESWQK